MEEQQTSTSAGEFAGKDVSKKTVVTLLVVTILVVALGIWTVLDRMGQTEKLTSDAGKVQVLILPNENAATGNAVSQTENTGESQITP